MSTTVNVTDTGSGPAGFTLALLTTNEGKPAYISLGRSRQPGSAAALMFESAGGWIVSGQAEEPHGACMARAGYAKGRIGVAVALAAVVALAVFAAGCDGGQQRSTSQQRSTRARASSESSRSPSWSPDGSRIAFVSGGRLNIVNPDGRNRLRLAGVWDFAWSPDGRRIALYRYDQIHVMRADGVGKRRLVANASAAPTWSPDGREIAFEAKGDIYVVKANGHGTRRLTHRSGRRVGYSEPAWSPDGRKIAFNRTTAVGRWWSQVWEIDVIDADGSHLRRLTRKFEADGPRWSPDGRRILFGAPSDWQLRVMNADGSNPHRLTSIRLSESEDCDFASIGTFSPLWSPEGRRIAFVARCKTSEIHVVNADGSNERSLTRGRRYNADSPTWSPDGRTIAFEGFFDHSEHSDIYVMNADGSHQRQLTK